MKELEKYTDLEVAKHLLRNLETDGLEATNEIWVRLIGGAHDVNFVFDENKKIKEVYITAATFYRSTKKEQNNERT